MSNSYANARVALAARRGYAPAFALAFRSGSVMGFALCGLALLVLYVALYFFNLHYPYLDDADVLMDTIAGYGLGGSSIAMFGRVGGGIYTKAADVGADLVGKVEKGIPEDDPRNPGVIADNVGDNVGDIAGMGADLFGSFAESSCAALVVAASSPDLNTSWSALVFPLTISAGGIFCCMGVRQAWCGPALLACAVLCCAVPGADGVSWCVSVQCSFLATHFMPVVKSTDIEKSLKLQLWSTTLLMTPILFILCRAFLPTSFCIKTINPVTPSACSDPSYYYEAFICIAAGLWAGLLIGLVTEYYTSHSYKPVREVAHASTRGTASNIIYGLALGYKSDIIPCFALAVTIFTSFKLCGMYGVALAALGMLSTLATGLTIDAYGPISDNAGGIAEMCAMGDYVRHRTDDLDAAGNTTAAIGKGFAIGSAALVSLALFGAFVTRAGIADRGVNILEPITFAGLLVGAMLPYWFFALTMKSVGIAANEMVDNIREQFADGRIMSGDKEPNYQQCVKISTDASLREMVAPGALVMLSPILVGCIFGVEATCGLLAGGLVSGVQMAISSSNTGGAWDNAKKYIEAGLDPNEQLRRNTDAHHAAVNGDTVGDPLKDTSGPALNILMKLMAIISLVFANFFVNHSLNLGAPTYA